MIPGTAIPTTRLTVDDAVQSVKPTQAITDILSEFKPGQRLVAEIQSQLPNGTYRALIAQRDVTLSLPFSAKPGDTLELEVVDTNGRLTFAVAAKAGEAPAGRESATTTLSLTAQLIESLQIKNADGKTSAPPAPLNAGQPIVPAPPKAGAATLAPLLQQAVSTSGLFYEAHQAAWIGGKMPQAALLLEPQGRLPPTLLPLPTLPVPAGGLPSTTAPNLSASAFQPPPLPGGNPAPMAGGSAAPTPAATPVGNAPNAAVANTVAHTTVNSPTATMASPGVTTADSTAAVRVAGAAAPAFASETAPLVQQQLNALATNVYAWHGVAWPGQRIEWEIIDQDAQHRGGDEGEAGSPWQTQLRLALPSLGAVDAVLRLRGQQVEVTLTAGREDVRKTLVAGGDTLRRQFEAAGLQLAALGVSVGQTARGNSDEAQ